MDSVGVHRRSGWNHYYCGCDYRDIEKKERAQDNGKNLFRKIYCHSVTNLNNDKLVDFKDIISLLITDRFRTAMLVIRMESIEMFQSGT